MKTVRILLLTLLASTGYLTACGPDCQSTCEKLYSKGGECKFTSAGDPDGQKNFSRCMETCQDAVLVPGDAGDYNPYEKTPSSQSVELNNDQQAAMWMDCVEEKSCELLKTSGGRFCAPIW